MPLFRRMPVTLVRGLGSEVWDDAGNRYLDLVAGWAVSNAGHCHPRIVKAIQDQASQLLQVSNQFYTVPQLELGEILVKKTGLDRVFFANSGAEANEGAVKLARRWGAEKRNGAYEVISTWKGFHGRTLAMVAATGKPAYQEPFKPLPEGFSHVDFGDLNALRNAITEKTAAFLVEPVQGEAGVNVATTEYLRGVREICDEKGILLILDEIQTGFGRTGTWFAFEQYGITPDILTLGKALAGGLPVGAFLARAEIADIFGKGNHGSTFGGNPLVCAAGVEMCKVMDDERLADRAATMGTIFVEKLQLLASRQSIITEIRASGLLLAVEFARECSGDIAAAAMSRGLLLNAVTPSAIRLMPALNITEAEVDEAITILDGVLSEQMATA